MNQPKTILITGGAGFIGSHLVDALLKDGHRVIVVDNLSTGCSRNLNPKAEFHQVDINDPALDGIFALSQPSLVYLLAFNTNVPKSVTDPVFDCGSLTGSLKTLELCRKHGVEKVVFSSTSFVYGNTPNLPTPETEPAIPDNPYIITKCATENYIQFYNKAYGLEFVIFRFATTYGPRQTGGAMADYIRSIHAGRSAVMYGDGSKTRDYIFVGDVVNANLMALEYETKPGISPIFNLSSGTETALNTLYSKIGETLGRPEAKPEYMPDRPGELARLKLDNTKAWEILGWQPQVTLEDGLKQTITFFLNQ